MDTWFPYDRALVCACAFDCAKWISEPGIRTSDDPSIVEAVDSPSPQNSPSQGASEGVHVL